MNKIDDEKKKKKETKMNKIIAEKRAAEAAMRPRATVQYRWTRIRTVNVVGNEANKKHIYAKTYKRRKANNNEQQKNNV